MGDRFAGRGKGDPRQTPLEAENERLRLAIIELDGQLEGAKSRLQYLETQYFDEAKPITDEDPHWETRKYEPAES